MFLSELNGRPGSIEQASHAGLVRPGAQKTGPIRRLRLRLPSEAGVQKSDRAGAEPIANPESQSSRRRSDADNLAGGGTALAGCGKTVSAPCSRHGNRRSDDSNRPRGMLKEAAQRDRSRRGGEERGTYLAVLEPVALITCEQIVTLPQSGFPVH